MKNGRFSDAQIMAFLKQAESGVPVSELCRKHGMSVTKLECKDAHCCQKPLANTGTPKRVQTV